MCGIIALGTCVAAAGDWPKLGGPGGGWASPDEKNLISSFPSNGPALLWQNTMAGPGVGFSGPVVSRGRVFVMSGHDSGTAADVLNCFDAVTGKSLWTNAFAVWTDSKNESAWCTPTVDGKYVYARGPDAEVKCLSVKKGEEIWSWPTNKATLAGLSGRDFYFIAGRMIVCDELLILDRNTSTSNAVLMALNKKTGAEVWAREHVAWGYGGANPSIVDLGRRKVIIAGDIVVDALTGSTLGKWGGIAEWATTVKGNRVYGIGGRGLACFELVDNGTNVISTKKWDAEGEKAFGASVIVGNEIYVFWGKVSKGDGVSCFDAATGAKVWGPVPLATPKCIGYSCAVGAGGKIFTLWDGCVSMFPANPSGYADMGSFRAFEPVTSGDGFSSPAISNGRLYVRDGKGIIKCYDISAHRSLCGRVFAFFR